MKINIEDFLDVNNIDLPGEETKGPLRYHGKLIRVSAKRARNGLARGDAEVYDAHVAEILKEPMAKGARK